ncbi:MAG: hypothetical protein RLZZ361_1435 [Cyanobacteriota bacterium]|jgi:hypothetical protein
MSTTGRNSTIRLAIIRSQIDQQQQVIAMLENRLQESILGGTDTGSFTEDLNLFGILDDVARIYKDKNDGVTDNPTYFGLTGAMQKGIQLNEGYGFDPLAAVEQDTLRQFLYQARALLGELRVEEQHWNGEVNEEKQRRKELGDFTKG